MLWEDRVELSKLPQVPSWWGLLFCSWAQRTGCGSFGRGTISLADLVAFGGRGPGDTFLWLAIFSRNPVPLGHPCSHGPDSRHHFQPNHLSVTAAGFQTRHLHAAVPWRSCFKGRKHSSIWPAMPLEVAQACSGIRSLLSLITLAIIYGYLMETRIAIRIVLALASIPIAILANSLRIVGTGLLRAILGRGPGRGLFSYFSGMADFCGFAVCLYLLHQLLRMGRKELR